MDTRQMTPEELAQLREVIKEALGSVKKKPTVTGECCGFVADILKSTVKRTVNIGKAVYSIVSEAVD